MSLELSLLIWSVALTFIQMLIAVSACTLEFGLPKLAGNREGLPPASGFAGRAQRAHHNMLESLVLFAVLAVVTEITNRNRALRARRVRDHLHRRPAMGAHSGVGRLDGRTEPDFPSARAVRLSPTSGTRRT